MLLEKLTLVEQDSYPQLSHASMVLRLNTLTPWSSHQPKEVDLIISIP